MRTQRSLEQPEDTRPSDCQGWCGRFELWNLKRPGRGHGVRSGVVDRRLHDVTAVNPAAAGEWESDLRVGRTAG